MEVAARTKRAQKAVKWQGQGAEEMASALLDGPDRAGLWPKLSTVEEGSIVMALSSLEAKSTAKISASEYRKIEAQKHKVAGSALPAAERKIAAAAAAQEADDVSDPDVSVIKEIVNIIGIDEAGDKEQDVDSAPEPKKPKRRAGQST